MMTDDNLAMTAKQASSNEDFDYDKDHDASCPPYMPRAIAVALVVLIDSSCGPALNDVTMTSSGPNRHPSSAFSIGGVVNPFRGLLRVRRSSDLALTALFGLAFDFDLLGNDHESAALIFGAIARRYCRADGTTTMGSNGGGGAAASSIFNEEDYGSLLRKQINLQYFLDCLRIRLDQSVVSSTKGMALLHIASSVRTDDTMAMESIASSLSDILYTMLLSTLTSAAGQNVTRGERDVGALVATLTECPLGSLTAHVVTTSIVRLLVKCGVLSSLCLTRGSNSASINQRKNSRGSGGRARDPEDIALESRLGRNMLLCHYHDIVAPLLLSRSTPRFSSVQQQHDEDIAGEKNQVSSRSLVDFTSNGSAANDKTPRSLLDWTHHWRLSLLTFAVRLYNSALYSIFVPVSSSQSSHHPLHATFSVADFLGEHGRESGNIFLYWTIAPLCWKSWFARWCNFGVHEQRQEGGWGEYAGGVIVLPRAEFVERG